MANPTSSPSKACPTCGSRIADDAPSCLVCGTTFDNAPTTKSQPKAQAKADTPQPTPSRTRKPNEITISAPAAVAFAIIFLAFGSGLVFGTLKLLGGISDEPAPPTETITPTASQTLLPSSPTTTATQLPTLTPISYFVKSGDTCGPIANAFNVSIQSILILNNLDESCLLFIDQELKIPHPTPTLTPAASNTPSEAQLTRTSCETYDHVVQENETMSLIAFSYAVPQTRIMEWNNLTLDTVFIGQRIKIPLCYVEVVGGSTVTPSPAPEYQSPELLLPRDGASFSSSTESIPLQWASVGELRDNEFYQVIVVDITSGSTIQIIAYVTETEFSVPVSLRPSDNRPHIFKWQVVPVAQVGVKADGTPLFVIGGPPSISLSFTWSGDSQPAQPTATP